MLCLATVSIRHGVLSARHRVLLQWRQDAHLMA